MTGLTFGMADAIVESAIEDQSDIFAASAIPSLSLLAVVEPATRARYPDLEATIARLASRGSVALSASGWAQRVEDNAFILNARASHEPRVG